MLQVTAYFYWKVNCRTSPAAHWSLVGPVAESTAFAMAKKGIDLLNVCCSDKPAPCHWHVCQSGDYDSTEDFLTVLVVWCQTICDKLELTLLTIVNKLMLTYNAVYSIWYLGDVQDQDKNCCIIYWYRHVKVLMCLQFMMTCTTKLELGSCARVLYDWEGNEVKRLDDGKMYFTDSLLNLV